MLIRALSYWMHIIHVELPIKPQRNDSKAMTSGILGKEVISRKVNSRKSSRLSFQNTLAPWDDTMIYRHPGKSGPRISWDRWVGGPLWPYMFLTKATGQTAPPPTCFVITHVSGVGWPENQAWNEVGVHLSVWQLYSTSKVCIVWWLC